MVCQKCPVCQVFIDNEQVTDRTADSLGSPQASVAVKFSYGKPGTRDRLFARVCQYTSNPGCINKIADYSELKPRESDYYKDLPPLC